MYYRIRKWEWSTFVSKWEECVLTNVYRQVFQLSLFETLHFKRFFQIWAIHSPIGHRVLPFDSCVALFFVIQHTSSQLYIGLRLSALTKLSEAYVKFPVTPSNWLVINLSLSLALCILSNPRNNSFNREMEKIIFPFRSLVLLIQNLANDFEFYFGQNLALLILLLRIIMFTFGLFAIWIHIFLQKVWKLFILWKDKIYEIGGINTSIGWRSEDG